MSEELVKVLEIPFNSDGNEEYLIECIDNENQSIQNNDKPIDVWKTSEELMDCQQLVEELSQSKANGNCVPNGNACDQPIGQTVETGDKCVDKQLENGFDRGFRPFKILGAKHDNQNGLMFLVMFREDLTKADLIPNHILHQKCPQLLIKFYEKNTLWKRK